MKKPLGIGLVLLFLTLLAGGVYLWVSGTTLAELVGLAAEGGEKILREPIRPPREGPRVLVIALDGVGDNEFRAALAEGNAPHLQRLIGAALEDPDLYEHAYAASGALSILPSTTLAAWTSIFTGEPPARSGVPGNEWFVREERTFYAPAPVSVTGSDHAVAVYAEDLMGAAIRIPTVYERADVRSYVSLGHIHRGADLLTIPGLGDLAELVASFTTGLVDDDEVTSDAYAALDQAAAESLVTTIRDHGLADLQVVYFPGVDLYSHVANEPLPDQRNYLRDVVDAAVGTILAEYEGRGALENTYVLIVSDHGHTPVLSDERHALGDEDANELEAILTAADFRVRPFELEIDEEDEDFQATVAYQGAIAYLYLADRSTCAAEGELCDWIAAPRLEEDVLPVVRAIDAANLSGTGLPELQGTLDLIFAREPRPVGEDALPFQVWSGGRLIPVGEYLAASPRPDLLDLERRLEGLAVGPYGHRAGDILLLTKTGLERPIEERFYFSNRYRSWHGSASAQDGIIPFVLARAGGSGAEMRDLLQPIFGDQPSQLDITPAILRLLERQ